MFGDSSARTGTVRVAPFNYIKVSDTIDRRFTCPMPVAHSQIDDPMPVAGFVPSADGALSGALSRTTVPAAFGVRTPRLSPCNNPLDTKQH